MNKQITQLTYPSPFVLDKKAACALIGGYVKSRRRGSLTECDIECCTDNNCIDKGKTKLESCAENISVKKTKKLSMVFFYHRNSTQSEDRVSVLSFR